MNQLQLALLRQHHAAMRAEMLAGAFPFMETSTDDGLGRYAEMTRAQTIAFDGAERLVLDYIQDPGHGWIGADIQHLRALKLAETISEYSYRDGDLVWLEEDCDAPRYLRALSAAGVPHRIVDTYTRNDAWIRRLPHYFDGQHFAVTDDGYTEVLKPSREAPSREVAK